MAEPKVAKKPDMVQIRLPRKGANDDNYELVGLNGKMYQVPCGKPVEVPVAVHELLLRQQAARDALLDVQEAIPNEG